MVNWTRTRESMLLLLKRMFVSIVSPSLRVLVSTVMTTAIESPASTRPDRGSGVTSCEKLVALQRSTDPSGPSLSTNRTAAGLALLKVSVDWLKARRAFEKWRLQLPSRNARATAPSMRNHGQQDTPPLGRLL